MANKIIIKKSAVPGKTPQSTDLDFGELAINYADGKIYYKNSQGIVESISGQSFETPSAGSPYAVPRARQFFFGSL